jgi:small nuclear ribonucleoprotein (snRNP)-like protein
MRRDRLLKQYLRERFVVTLKTGETFDGLLDDWDTQTVQLVNPVAVGEKARVQVDGQILLPRDQIAYMQRPGG